MILADSSAWIDYLRHRATPASAALRAAMLRDELRLCDPIVHELLTGARDVANADRIARVIGAFTALPTVSGDWEAAAAIRRTARWQGLTIRSALDCLIAAIAIRTGATVLHNDADFDAIARITALRATRG